jgi:energy-coupling factor transport system permease protein
MYGGRRMNITADGTRSLDPRTKFIVLAASFAVLIIVWDARYLLCIGALIVLYGYFVGGLRLIVRFWWALAIITIFTVAIWAVYLKGETILFWVVSMQSIAYGITTALKLDFMICSSVFYFTRITPDEMAAGFTRMGLPFPVAFSFSYAMRLFPLILTDAREIARIQESRGLDLKSGTPLARFKKYIPLLTPIFLTTIRNTNHLAMALESRGFGKRRCRDGYLKLALGRVDWLVIIAAGVMTVLFAFLRIMGYGAIGDVVRRW